MVMVDFAKGSIKCLILNGESDRLRMVSEEIRTKFMKKHS